MGMNIKVIRNGTPAKKYNSLDKSAGTKAVRRANQNYSNTYDEKSYRTRYLNLHNFTEHRIQTNIRILTHSVILSESCHNIGHGQQITDDESRTMKYERIWSHKV